MHFSCKSLWCDGHFHESTPKLAGSKRTNVRKSWGKKVFCKTVLFWLGRYVMSRCDVPPVPDALLPVSVEDSTTETQAEQSSGFL